MVELVEHFKRDERSRHSDWLRQQRWFIKARQDRERRQIEQEKLDDGVSAFASSAIIATETAIAEFQSKLDAYDAATVAALMENQERLDAIREEIADMLHNAYVLEDGRRVFKTEDGSQVIDEFGDEISKDELDFDLIGPQRPTWEEYSAGVTLEAQLSEERDQLIEFQDKIDNARDEIADGELSQSELDDLNAELEELAPPTVTSRLPGTDSAFEAEGKGVDEPASSPTDYAKRMEVAEPILLPRP